MVIETSSVSPVETKLDLFFCSHENRILRYRTASVHTRTEFYDIVPLLFTQERNGTVRYRIVPISASLFRTAQFLDLFWNRLLDFFRTRVNPTPLRTTLERTEVERYDIVPV